MTFQSTITEMVALLDSYGFDIGDYRVSIYRALVIVLVVIAILISGRLFNLVARRLLRRSSRLDATQRLLGEKVTSLVIWIGLFLAGIDYLGISLTAFTVFSGAFGLAVGFGLQKTFGNLISGIILLMDRSIKPGDVIAVGDGSTRTFGEVNRIGIRAVSVITRDKIEYIIPNETLMTSQVENWSYSSRDVRIKVPVSVAYDTDIDLAERLMLEAAHNLPRLRKDLQPKIWLTAFGDSALLFEVLVWIDDPEAGIGSLRSELLKEILVRFRNNGIRIPFPQREVRMSGTPAGSSRQRAKPGSDKIS